MATPTAKKEDAEVFVYDRRFSDAPELKIPIGGISKLEEFTEAVKKALDVKDGEEFVIATTNREEIKTDQAWDCIQSGDTLYVLKDVDQELCAPAQERVDYLPHYDTIVKGGMYEYYASEGQNPLPFAFAELIDNSLAATALNDGSRKIELRLFIDESAASRNCIMVVDNGIGMTPRQLNNWAIYRLSKFTRREKRGRGPDGDGVAVNADESLSLNNTWAPRFMNSDISYFGVGGKQAVFFIGTSTRMISKPKDSKDVHELSISKDEFEKKEKNNQSIYTGYIRNRQPGDSSHIPADEEFLIKLISEEKERENFTAVVIQGVNPQHVAFLRQNFKMWTRQLAHIYHFYLHGPDGNILKQDSEDKSNPFNNIDIQVMMQTRNNPNPKSVNLRDVEDDIETQYVRTAASTFEFKAFVDGAAAVEGIIRYHPFLYDRETYPIDMYGARLDPVPEDDHGYAINEKPARGRRPIFEAFWNGRLIPYTLIEDFDWCSLPKRQKNIPTDCYNRISGVLWTSDSFQVSTNKLTFLDLEMRLKDKNTNFTRMVNGHEKRTQIEKEFQAWLKDCHEVHDKQILFSGNKGAATRTDLPKHRQTPWTKFTSVEWDNKAYEQGQMVRILRTTPPLHGTIEAIYLYGEYEGDVFATGGDLELLQEPQSLYTERKFVPLSRLDRGASLPQIKKYIEDEEMKLPDHLVLYWPHGMSVTNGEKRMAGQTIGAIKVEICNKRGEKISKIPHSTAGTKKLLVELTLIWHSPQGDEKLVSHVSQHGKSWPYWFFKMDSAKHLGNYTLILQAVLNESGNTTFAGRELPSKKIKFFVSEAEPERFTVGVLDGPFKVGLPFNIPLEFQDKFNNSTRAPAKLQPVLDADGLELSYDNMQIKGNNCSIKGVVAKGVVYSAAGKNFNLTVSIPGLDQSQSLKIRLLPGPPAKLHVIPEEDQTIENGSSPTYTVEIHDPAGNVTCGGKLIVNCKFTGMPVTPQLLSCDCSTTGTSTISGTPIFVSKLQGVKTLKPQFEIHGMRTIKTVTRVLHVTPSGRVARLELFGGKDMEIKHNCTLELDAGKILENLRFELYNEAGDEVEMTDKLVQKIKVNWAPKVPKDLAMKKGLPSLSVPTSVIEKKYCQVSFMEGEGVELQFNIKALPGLPSQLESMLAGETCCRLGQPLAGVIQVKIKDKYGNQVNLSAGAGKELTCTCSSLQTEEVKIAVLNNVLVVTNLIFTEMGVKEVTLKWRELTSHIRCTVLSGPPALLQVLDWLPDQPIQTTCDKPLAQAFRVQLMDAEKNPCQMSDVKVHIVKDSNLKMKESVPSFVKTDKDGIADFGVFTVTSPLGKYELQPKAMGKSVINGPKIVIEVQADPSKPGKMEVEYNTKATIIAGHTLPDITVKIFSETGGPLTTSKPDHLSMKLWKREGSNEESGRTKATSIHPDSDVKADPGTFQFRKCPVPENAGSYTFVFVYFDGTHELYSSMNALEVQPSTPAALVSVDFLTTPTVSNTRSVTSRTLIKSLRLELRDEYDNAMGEGYSGTVTVEITSSNKAEEVPCFLSGSSSATFNMVNGQCTVQNLVLQENASGKDGFEYQLQFSVSCDKIPKNKQLAPLMVPFLFYNDAKMMQQMTALSKERDTLRGTIQAYKSMFDTQQQLIAEFRAAVHQSQKEEQALRADLRKQNIPSNQLESVDTVEKLIQARIKDRENLLQKPRRSCQLSQADPEPEILGKIAHLALVHGDDIARVLSWHMSADMDCVVTLTTQKAKELYQKTQGKQQVLPLDSIYRKNLPDWDKPLPHVRFRPAYKPVGNPVYARNLLEFTKDEDSCRVVFGMLLGDTLILDTLDNANLYRQEIVRYTHCPTILTRSGDRIRSNGKFGGAMNKAPPVEKLKGCVFGQPLPMAYHAVCTQIDTLERYKTALICHIQSQDELQEQINQQKLPETKAKYKECKEMEARLKEVEQKLGMGLSGRGRKSGSRTSLEEPVLKKPKPEPGVTPTSSSSNSPALASISTPVQDPSITPSRTSLRIASMTTVVSDDGRKRLKKST